MEPRSDQSMVSSFSAVHRKAISSSIVAQPSILDWSALAPWHRDSLQAQVFPESLLKGFVVMPLPVLAYLD